LQKPIKTVLEPVLRACRSVLVEFRLKLKRTRANFSTITRSNAIKSGLALLISYIYFITLRLEDFERVFCFLFSNARNPKWLLQIEVEALWRQKLTSKRTRKFRGNHNKAEKQFSCSNSQISLRNFRGN
jgi:hypothetical protein